MQPQLLIVAVLACLLVACSEAAQGQPALPTSAASATARPEPTSTPPPAPEPTVEPRPEPTPEPPPTEGPPPPRPDNVTLTVRAVLIAFQPTRLTAPAGSRVTLVMQNEDRNVPHDIAVRVPGAPASTQCNGPCTVSITFTAPGPGSYQFYCPVHPTDMVGTLVVTP